MLRSKRSTFDNPSCLISVSLIGLLLCWSRASSTQAASDLVVRWHGDYYQHLWDSAFAGGSDPAVRENRWLRGGPVTGNQHSQQDLDLDNDGQFDDSRVYFSFSLDVPLNPPDTNSKPNGIIYHSELPNAQFYGGISADFYNYETDRIQQAFIENDGGGGELDDVGYPSPYLTPEFQGQSDFIESARHSDGRPKKHHVGPHEDFAINLYRPDLPHPLDIQDDPADNLVTFHAAFIWRKQDFLAGGDSAPVSIDSESSISFESTRWWNNVGEARWILQSDDGQLYISQHSAAGAQDDWGATNALIDPLSSDWAVYSPSTDNLDFDAAAANWIDPVTNHIFSDIQAVGVYIGNDTPSGDLTKFSLGEVRLNAQVGTLFDTADFNVDGSVDADDLAIWRAAFGETDAGDADGDGKTGGDDFLMWQSQLDSAASELAMAHTVALPEPSSILLLWTVSMTLSSRPRACRLVPITSGSH